MTRSAPSSFPVPVLGFAAWSETGKTTLLTSLVPWLVTRGLRVGRIKHAHHNFDIDHPGKDSYKLRKAGADQVLVASDRRSAWVVENPAPAEPQLAALVRQLDTDHLDLVLVEGFRHAHFPQNRAAPAGARSAATLPPRRPYRRDRQRCAVVRVACTRPPSCRPEKHPRRRRTGRADDDVLTLHLWRTPADKRPSPAGFAPAGTPPHC